MSASRGKRGVRAAIEGAQAATGTNFTCPRIPVYLLSRFEMRPEGLFRKSADDEKPPLWVCGPFSIEAETLGDDGQRWGILLT
jgi:hypothetical protein